MSFVTVFTAGTMAFVLLVPLLMLLVLSSVSPTRRANHESPARPVAEEPTPAARLSRAA